LKKLEILQLMNTKVSPAGVADLKRALPALSVY